MEDTHTNSRPWTCTVAPRFTGRSRLCCVGDALCDVDPGGAGAASQYRILVCGHRLSSRDEETLLAAVRHLPAGPQAGPRRPAHCGEETHEDSGVRHAPVSSRHEERQRRSDPPVRAGHPVPAANRTSITRRIDPRFTALSPGRADCSGVNTCWTPTWLTVALYLQA